MSQKLFPILADPNPPSSFDGIDLTLASGQMTALDGADSFTMTASTLTANSVSASWADIVDAVVNPPASTLQFVLDTGNTASDQSISLSETTSDFTTIMNAISFSAYLGATNSAGFNAESFSMNDLAGGFVSTISPAYFRAGETTNNEEAVMTNTELTVVNATLGKTMVVSSGSVTATNSNNDDVNVMSSASVSLTNVNAGITSTSVLSGPSLNITNVNDVITSTSVLSGPSLNLTKAESGSVDITAVLSPVSLNLTSDSTNTVLNSDTLTLSYTPPSGIPTTVVIGSEFITSTKQTFISDLSPERLQFTNDTFPEALGSIGVGGATFQSLDASVVLDGLEGSVVATSGTDVNTFSPTQLSVESASASSVLSPASLVLTSEADSLTLSPTLSASVGGSTDQYLVITINEIAYRISLLAPP